MDVSPALGVLVGATGLWGQLKLPPSNSFYIPKKWNNICDPVVTGSPLLRSHYFNCYPVSEFPHETQLTPSLKVLILLKVSWGVQTGARVAGVMYGAGNFTSSPE